MSKLKSTHLGQYLRELREQRGYESIQEYVRHYKLPVSYVYYTEIESGKKRISLDSSRQLCESLDIDKFAFLYHLLKDILPEEIQSDFLRLIPTTFYDKEREEAKAELIKDAYQKLRLARLEMKIGYMGDEAEIYMYENHQLMPLLAVIYCVSSISEEKLGRIAKRLGIAIDIEEITGKFESFGLIKITEDAQSKSKLLTRVSDLILTRDKRTGAQRIKSETQATISQCADVSVSDANGPSCFHGVIGLSKENQAELLTHLSDIDTEYRARHQSESSLNPQLLTILFSPLKI